MLNLHIPQIGDKITLVEPWSFTLHEERRNLTLIKKVDPTYAGNGYGTPGVYGPARTPNSWQVTLPVGWELRVDRIYIRQNQRAFDSITFSCPYNGNRVRFWVKLEDANKKMTTEQE